jgi:glutathione peroxidase
LLKAASAQPGYAAGDLTLSKEVAMIDRRAFVIAALATSAGPSCSRTVLAQGVSKITAYAFSFPALSGGDLRLAEFTGRPLLIVNTASLCGYTPQYAALQELWSEFRERGLVIIGVPSNDFGGQEPGGA